MVRCGSPAFSMEFTVSKTDLVRELSLSQVVVEKKTTLKLSLGLALPVQGGISETGMLSVCRIWKRSLTTIR